jgi:hypothetical protein
VTLIAAFMGVEHGSELVSRGVNRGFLEVNAGVFDKVWTKNGRMSMSVAT